MQVKTTTNETIDLRTLKLEEAVPEQQIEIYRHVHTQQFYIRHLDGRFEPVSWAHGCQEPDPSDGKTCPDRGGAVTSEPRRPSGSPTKLLWETAKGRVDLYDANRSGPVPSNCSRYSKRTSRQTLE